MPANSSLLLFTSCRCRQEHNTVVSWLKVTWGTWLAARWEFEDPQWTELDIRSEYRCWLLTEGQAACKRANIRDFLRAPLIACLATIGPDELVKDLQTMMNVWKAIPQWLVTAALDQNVHGAESLALRMKQGRVDIKKRRREDKKRKRTEDNGPEVTCFETDGEFERTTSSARSSLIFPHHPSCVY